MRKFIFRIFPKFSPFPKTFLGNSPIFPIPLRKKFFGEMEALNTPSFRSRKLFSKLTWSSWNLLILKMHPSHPLSCYYVVTYTSIHVSNILPLTCHVWPQGPTSFRALDLQEAFISSLNESLLKIRMKFSYSTFYNSYKNHCQLFL